MTINLKAKYMGALVGSALGDAIGELAFHHPSLDELLFTLESLQTLQYTDDTAMAIGLANSLLKRKQLDQEHLGETFRLNFQREPWRGYAAGPPTIFSIVASSGKSYVEAARSLFGGSGSLGNGAAMRIAPLGLFFHQSENLYEQAVASAEVTHAHPVGKDGAAVQAYAVAQMVKNDPATVFPQEEFIEGLIDFANTLEIREKMILLKTLLCEDIAPGDAAEQLGRSVAVQESMPFAIYSFLRHRDSFEDCLFCAIMNGGDRDTLGAMACAISGAYLGIDAVPNTWCERLEHIEIIVKIASELVEMSSSRWAN
jgi:poly(ADP-ribose) glycohydrolase ARH3